MSWGQISAGLLLVCLLLPSGCVETSSPRPRHVRLPPVRPATGRSQSDSHWRPAGEPTEPQTLATEDSGWHPTGSSDESSGQWASHKQQETDQELTNDKVENGAEPSGPVLNLQALANRSLAENPDLASAREQLRAAEAALDQAEAEFFPELNLAENYSVSNNPVSAFTFQLNQAGLSFNQDFNNPGTRDDFHTQVGLRHALYTGGKRQAEARATEAERDSGRFAWQQAQNEIIYQLAQAYYRLLQAKRLVAIRQEAVGQVRQHLEIARTRRRAGTAVKSDVLTVEVRFSEAREALLSAKNRLELAWSVLENVVGGSVQRRKLPEVVPEGPWSRQVEPLHSAVATARSRRPEVARLNARREAARQQVEAARAGHFPTIEMVANYDVHTGNFTDGNDSFFTGLMMQWNLLDGGRTRAEVQKALAQWRNVNARGRRLQLDIEHQVRQAYLKWKDARQRSNVSRTAVTQAEESLREIEVQYEQQTATVTELIDAQVRLSRARVRQTTARADLQVARAALERAIGRLSDTINP